MKKAKIPDDWVLGPPLFRPDVSFHALSDEAERTILLAAIAYYGGHMAKTARGLKLERSLLYKKLKGLKIALAKTDPPPKGVTT